MDISTDRLMYLAYQGATHLTYQYQCRAFSAQRLGDYAKAGSYFDLARGTYAEQQCLLDLIYGDPAIIDNDEYAEFLREE